MDSKPGTKELKELYTALLNTARQELAKLNMRAKPDPAKLKALWDKMESLEAWLAYLTNNSNKPETPSGDSAKSGEKKTGFANGYALIIGVAEYQKVNSLSKVVLKDAEDVNEVLQNPEYCGYLNDHIRLLTNEEATIAAIRDNLRWLANNAGEDSTALFFFSGHGARTEQYPQQENYLLPYDCDLEALKNTAISSREFTGLLISVKASRLLVVLDCCHAGGTGEVKGSLRGQPELKTGLDESYYVQLAQGKGRAILASSKSEEFSLILSGMDNSLFTHYFLEAMQGKPFSSDDGLVGVLDVFKYLSREIPKRSSKQHPIFKAEIEDNFPIALYRGGQKRVTEQNQSPIQSASNRNKVYIMSSPNDKTYFDEVEAALKVLTFNRSSLDIWHPGKIDPGAIKPTEFTKVFNTTRVAILLLSSDFLAAGSGDYSIINYQLKEIKAAYDKGEVIILPLIIGQSGYKHLKELKDLQPVNENKPLNSLNKANRNTILNTLVNQVDKILGE